MSVSARLGARISAPPVLGPALAVEARLDVDRDQGPLAQGRERAQRQVVDERAVDEQPPPPDLGWRKHRHAHAEPHAVRRRAEPADDELAGAQVRDGAEGAAPQLLDGHRPEDAAQHRLDACAADQRVPGHRVGRSGRRRTHSS